MLISLPIRMAVALFIGAGVLSGCTGYRPLYGRGTDQEAVAAQLSGIAVVEQRSRAGQLVRNELLSTMRGDGEAQFVLDLLPEETTRKVSRPVGQKLERFRYSLNTTYILRRGAGGAVVTEGKVFSAVSYDTVEQPIADLQAAENARLRASKEVAEEIRLRLAAFFASR